MSGRDIPPRNPITIKRGPGLVYGILVFLGWFTAVGIVLRCLAQ